MCLQWNIQPSTTILPTRIQYCGPWWLRECKAYIARDIFALKNVSLVLAAFDIGGPPRFSPTTPTALDRQAVAPRTELCVGPCKPRASEGALLDSQQINVRVVTKVTGLCKHILEC